MEEIMHMIFGNAKFLLGQVVSTPGAMRTFTPLQLLGCLGRHSIGDWGDLGEKDKQTNENALKHGERLFSRYDIGDKTLYIITERDRSVTTFLLPEEY